LEEERRLLYVACTRAKERLYLVYPEMSASPGHFAEPAMVSRFLDELPAALTSSAKRKFSFEGRSKSPGGTSTPQAAKKIAAADADLLNRHVRHPFFGAGKIVKKINKNTVQIFFDRHGQKTINLDYVKMEILP
jgi:DNA helicase-2/ATP-dependent DNA helicase PcrA